MKVRTARDVAEPSPAVKVAYEKAVREVAAAIKKLKAEMGASE